MQKDQDVALPSDEFEQSFERPCCALVFSDTVAAPLVEACAGWLQKGGFDAEAHTSSGNEGSQPFIVVSTGRRHLEQEAERLGFLKEHSAQQPFIDGQMIGKVEFFTGDTDFVGYENHDFWLPCERARLLQSLLERFKLPAEFHECIAAHCSATQWRRELAKKCSPRLLAGLRIVGVLDGLAPLHEASNRRKVWKAMPLWWPGTPQTELRNYFGSKVAFYFAWMNSFTTWLVPLAVIGVAAYARMLWCGHTHDDDPYLPFYSVVVVLWATAFLRYWQGQCDALAWQWGVYGVLRREEVRALYRGKMRISRVTGVQERHFEPWRRVLAYLVSLIVTLMMLGVAFLAMVCSLNLQGYMSDKATSFERKFHFPLLSQFAQKGALFDPDQEAYFGVLTYVPVVLHVFTIRKLNDFYSLVAYGLTHLENHKFTRDFEDAMIAKRFIFEAFDCYIAPFYVAFVQQDIRKLRSELIQVYVADSVRRVVLETLVPLATKVWQQRQRQVAYGKLKKEDDNGSSVDTSEEAGIVAELQDPVYDEFDDFLEMVLEFGYITLFASAFPLAGALSICCNILEMKSDFFKLVWVYQRPWASRSADLGTWGIVLKVIVIMAVLSNAMLLAMSEQLAQWFPDLYRAADEVDVATGLVAQTLDADGSSEMVVRGGSGRYVVLLAVFVEHVVGAAVILLWNMLPTRPEWVADEISRLEKHKEKSARRLQKAVLQKAENVKE